MIKPTRTWTAGLGLKTLVTLLLSTLLVSCGTGSKYDEFIPNRILSIGDAFSYTDFSTGSAINPNTSIAPDTGKTDHWLWTYAAGYGLTNLGAAPGVGKNVVFFNTNTQPSTSGSRNSLGTITQVQSQVLALPSPQDKDLVVMSVGIGDILAKADALGNTPATETDLADMRRIGLQYINLADNVYQLGYKQVMLLSAMDLSSSQYVATLSSTYKNNVSALTSALHFGSLRNCYGGCDENTERTYPPGEGVKKYDLFTLSQRIVQGTAIASNINNNTVGNTTTSPLCLYPTLLTACTPNSLYDSNNYPYYYSGDLYLSPLLHRYIGNVLYSFSRGRTGF